MHAAAGPPLAHLRLGSTVFFDAHRPLLRRPASNLVASARHQQHLAGGGTQCGHLAALEGHKDSLIACGVANDRTTSRGMGARKCMTLLAMGRTHWKDRLPAASMFLVSESEKDISLHGTIITTLLDRAELRQC